MVESGEDGTDRQVGGRAARPTAIKPSRSPRTRRRWPLWAAGAAVAIATAIGLSWALGLTSLGAANPDKLSGDPFDSAPASSVDDQATVADDVATNFVDPSLDPAAAIGDAAALANGVAPPADDPAARARAEMARLDGRKDAWDSERPAAPPKSRTVRDSAATAPPARSEAPGEPATRARARGSLPGLFSSDDYPQSALARGEQGTTIVQLGIDQSGRVETCRIVRSSGSTALDSATCAIFVRRARFDPAIDANGYRTADTLLQRINWRLP